MAAPAGAMAAPAGASDGDTLVPRAVRARVGAARVILAQHEGLDTHGAISRVQAAALADLFRTNALSPEACAMVADDLCRMNWHKDDARGLLDMLAPPKPPAALKRRRSQQNYLSILHFFTGPMWDIFLSAEESSETKKAMLLQFCIDLGLRCPTEHSIKLLTSIWVVLSETRDSLSKMTASSKFTLFKHFKGAFDRARRLAPDPVAYIEVLPSKPLLLLQQHPDLFKLCFKDSSPEDPRCDVMEIHRFDQSYACRNGGKCADSASQSAPVLDLAPGTSGSNIMQIASLFMDRFESLQQSQQRMVELFMGQSAGGRGSSLRSLAAIHDAQGLPLGTRRLPMKRSLGNAEEDDPRIHVIDRAAAAATPALALTAALPAAALPAPLPSLDGPEAVHAQRSSSASSLDGPTSSSAPSLAAPLSAIGGSSGDAVANRTAQMLDMLDARESAKKADKKALERAKLDRVDDGPSATPAAKIGGKAKAKGKAKLSPQKTAKPTAAAGKLGCTKCRYSLKGCARCRAMALA